MESNRRRFIKGAAGAALFSKTVTGANDRVNVGVVGVGARFYLLDAAYYKQEDVNVAAICDVNKNKLDAYQSKLKEKKFQTFTDYRRMFELKDIDAVVICAPDHQHAPIMIGALQAGKDVYVDKPASNTVDAAVAMLKAYRASNRVVQLGTQQRSWDHFRAAAKLIWDGYIGDVTHVIVAHSAGGPGGGGRGGAAGSTEKPEGLDWDAFLGPAKRVPYDSRRYSNWRAYWDYGGGMTTDWGVHWMDIVHLCMKSDYEGPSYTASVSVPNADPELVSTDWFINYKYAKYLMSFIGIVPSTAEPVADGPTFYGTKGWLRVNRNGYIVRANRAPVRMAFTAAGQAAAASAAGGRGPEGPGSAPPAQAGGPPAGARGGPGGTGRGGTPQAPPINDITEVDPAKNVPGERGSEIVHVRNFLDCVKSRQKPTAEFEIGFHSTLPCLLGRLSIQQQRAIVWDERNLVARPA
jgi:predicted dehydrogenase